MRPARRRLLAALLPALGGPAAAQPAGGPGFLRIAPAEGSLPVWLAARQVVRVARVEGHTVVDTAAWVQQRTAEPVEALAGRLREAGLRLVPLTDLRGARIYVAAERVVLVRETEERHAAGARASLVLVGLRFNTDVAVREPVEAVMAALRRDAAGQPELPAAPTPR